MVKKKSVSKKSIKKYDPISQDNFMDFIFGIIALFVIEMVFMLGGLYVEKNILGVSATGIPSLLGLLFWFVASFIYSKKYLFLGGVVISVLVPIILIIVTLTGFVSFSSIMYYSIALFVILELVALKRLLKKN